MKYLFLFAMLLAGCGHKDIAPEKAQQQKPKTEISDVDRFKPFKGLSGVSLDTKTGKLCRNFDPATAAGKDAEVPSRYSDAPLCSSLIDRN